MHSGKLLAWTRPPRSSLAPARRAWDIAAKLVEADGVERWVCPAGQWRATMRHHAPGMQRGLILQTLTGRASRIASARRMPLEDVFVSHGDEGEGQNLRKQFDLCNTVNVPR
jgi:hypothetical protein